MKLPCAVIQDLLPLYAEDLTSDVSKTLVEEHLPECEDCRKALEELQAPQPQVPREAVPMQRVKKLLRKQLWLAVVLTVCVVIAVGIPFFHWLYSDVDMPYQEGMITIRENPDGSIDAVFDRPLGWIWIDTLTDKETGLVRRVISCQAASPIYRSTHEHHTSDVYTIADPSERCDLIYYENDAVGGEHILLWGTEPLGWPQVITLPRLALNYYLLLAGALTLLFVLLWVAFRKRTSFPGYTALGFGSYILAHLLIKGFEGTTYFLLQDLAFILLTAIALFGAACSAIALYRLQKDR